VLDFVSSGINTRKMVIKARIQLKKGPVAQDYINMAWSWKIYSPGAQLATELCIFHVQSQLLGY
jgi:hypothetical protein